MQFLLTVTVIIILNAGWTLSSSIPSEVAIGGMFGYMTPSGEQVLDQAEHLAAFLMAIREVNNKADGLFDDLLPHTKILFAVEGATSLPSAAVNFVDFKKAFYGEGVFGVVNSLNNDNAIVVNEIATRMEIPNILSFANAGAFNSFSNFPYASKVVALDTLQGLVYQNLLCSMGIRRIGIFVGAGSDDTEEWYKLIEGSKCTFEILSQVIIQVDSISMKNAVATAKQGGARYFVVFLPSFQTAALMEEGYSQGLFGDHTVIFTPDRGSQNLTQYLSVDRDATKMLTGLFTLQYWPNYFMNRTDLARNFAKRWKGQPSTAGTVVNGKRVCDATTDDFGQQYLFQHAVEGNLSCIGIDFSKYDDAGLMMQPHTAMTYDATILMLMAVDFAVKNGLDYTNADVFQELIISNVSYTGISGKIGLRKGYPSLNYASRGNRITNSMYRVLNFNPDVYKWSVEDSLVPVGSIMSDVYGVQWCGPVDYVSCFPPTYTTDGDIHVAPADMPAAIYVNVSLSFKSVLQAISAILLLLILAFSLFTFVYRRHKAIKASQPILLACILVGALIAAARISIGGIDKNESLCRSEFWLGHLSFIIMIGSLFVKSYRVHCIVNTKKLLRVKFTAWSAFKLLVGIMCGGIVCLTIATALGKPGLSHLRQVESNQETVWEYCSLTFPQYQTALFVLEFSLLMFSFHTCWEIRNVPDIVNESKQISTAMSAIVLVSILILPIVFLIGLPPYTCEFIASLGFGFGAVVTLVLLFTPKLVMVFNIGGPKNVHSAKVVAATHDILMSDKRANPDMQLSGPPKCIHDADELLKSKPKEERMVLCQQQLVGWQMRLLQEQRAAIGSSSECSLSNTGHGTSAAGKVVYHSNNLSLSTDADAAILLGSNEKDGEFYVSRDGLNIGKAALEPLIENEVVDFQEKNTVTTLKTTLKTQDLLMQDVA